MDEQQIPSSPEDFRKQLYRMTGIDFGNYKTAHFDKCVAKRMQTLSLSSFAAYGEYLAARRGELNELLESFTVYHSQFMRDPAKYRVLKELVLPEKLAALKPGGTLKIWSAGCAAGEEPYSIAMILLEMMQETGRNFAVSLQATDINTALLRKAAEGVYSSLEFTGKEIEERFLFKYFERRGDDFRVKDEVRRLVRFSPSNLIADEPPHGCDIIFCRNVFIYFEPAAVRTIVARFHRHLTAGGYLFLGNSEILDDHFYCHFRKIKKQGEFVYRKIEENSDEFREMQLKQKTIRAGLGLRS